MAADSWVARFLRALTAVALRIRRPARRAFGSVPAAVAICAFVVGIYDLVIRFHYVEGFGDFYWDPLGFRQLKHIAGYTAFVASLSDVVLVFGVIQREEKNLEYILCGVLTLFTFCGPMPFIMLILAACRRHWFSILWEIPRLWSEIRIHRIPTLAWNVNILGLVCVFFHSLLVVTDIEKA